MRGHFVVCGLGQVGYRVTSLLLDLGEQVAVVTREARNEWVREVQDRGASVIFGDACDYEQLRKADPEHALAILALTSSDPNNVEIALDIQRRLPDMRVVARIFDQTLARQVRNTLGIDRALAMSVESAPAFASAALGERVVNEFHYQDQEWLVVRETVGEQHPWRGQLTYEIQKDADFAILMHVRADGSVTEPSAEQFPIETGDIVKVLAQAGHPAFAQDAPVRASSSKPIFNPLRTIHFFRKAWRNTSRELRSVFLSMTVLILISVVVFRYGMNLSPVDAFYYVITTVTTTGYGDITPKDAAPWLKLYCCLMMILGSAAIAVLYSIITDYIVTSRLQQFAGSHAVPDSDHVVVMGLGDVGYRVIERLLESHTRLVVVDASPDTKYLQAIRKRVAVVVGDGREPETLESANIRHARSFVALTGVDSVNLSAGLLAAEMNPDLRMILRIFDGNFAEKIQSRLPVNLAASASYLAAPAFVGAALDPSTLTSFVLRGRLISLAPLDPTGLRPDQRLLAIGPHAKFALTTRELKEKRN